jgi:hypothetical protein
VERVERLYSGSRRLGYVAALWPVVRVEVEQGSPLPVQLEKAGHRLHHAGMTTRIGPGFRTVDVLELDLSGR